MSLLDGISSNKASTVSKTSPASTGLLGGIELNKPSTDFVYTEPAPEAPVVKPKETFISQDHGTGIPESSYLKSDSVFASLGRSLLPEFLSKEFGISKEQRSTPLMTSAEEMKRAATDATKSIMNKNPDAIDPLEYVRRGLSFGHELNPSTAFDPKATDISVTDLPEPVTTPQKIAQAIGSTITMALAQPLIEARVAALLGKASKSIPSLGKAVDVIKTKELTNPWTVGFGVSIAKNASLGGLFGLLTKNRATVAQNVLETAGWFAAFGAIAYPIQTFFKPILKQVGKATIGNTKAQSIFNSPEVAGEKPISETIWFKNPNDETQLLKVTANGLEFKSVPAGEMVEKGVYVKDVPTITHVDIEAFKQTNSAAQGTANIYRQLKQWITGKFPSQPNVEFVKTPGETKVPSDISIFDQKPIITPENISSPTVLQKVISEGASLVNPTPEQVQQISIATDQLKHYVSINANKIELIPQTSSEQGSPSISVTTVPLDNGTYLAGSEVQIGGNFFVASPEHSNVYQNEEQAISAAKAQIVTELKRQLSFTKDPAQQAVISQSIAEVMKPTTSRNAQNAPTAQEAEKMVNDMNRGVNERGTAEMTRKALSGELDATRLDTPKNLQNAIDYKSNNLPSDATPETIVPVFRAGATPIKEGDQVTLVRKNAEKYVQQRAGSIVQTKPVPLKDLVHNGGLKSEFIYAPKKPSAKKSLKEKREEKKAEETHLEKAKEALRKAKGLSASDIMKTYPDIELKRDVPVTDIHGKKSVIPEGEALTPYELKGNKVLLQDGETYIVSKNQFANIKGNATTGEAKEFAPEMKGTEETVKGAGGWEGNEYISDGQRIANVVENEDGTWTYQSDFAEGSDTFETRKEAMDAVMEEVTDPYAETGTKYEQYTLPGGENYKEILVKAPMDNGAPKETFDIKQISQNEFVVENNRPTDVADAEVGPVHSTREEAQAYLEKIANETPASFRSSHWSEPNVLFHLRMNERTFEGKKVAFMEELQSDWAREERQATKNEADALAKTLEGYKRDIQVLENSSDVVNKEEKIAALNEAIANTKSVLEKFPSSPLLKKWETIAVKRALKEAVDTDAEYFAWINGAQTSARYKLSRQIRSVSWSPKEYTTLRGEKTPLAKEVVLDPIGHGEMILHIDKYGEILRSSFGVGVNEMIGKKLDEVIGKGLADSIMKDENGKLSGEGLNFGGEWAKNLYDKQVGVIVRDLTGAKIETLDMGLPVEAKGNNWRNVGDPYAKALTEADLIVGKEIYRNQTDNYIITDVLGEGKFKAVSKDFHDSMKGRWLDMEKDENWMSRLDGHKETFDISTKTTTQQGIRLTDEVKRIIRGEAPEIKKPSGKDPFAKTEIDTQSLVKFLHKDAFGGSNKNYDALVKEAEKLGLEVESGDSEGARLYLPHEKRSGMSMEDAAVLFSSIVNEKAKITGATYHMEPNADGTLTAYHGTSAKNAKSINENGFDTDAYLSPEKGKEAGGVGGAMEYGNDVFAVTFDPRYMEINGLGEIKLVETDPIISFKQISWSNQSAQDVGKQLPEPSTMTPTQEPIVTSALKKKAQSEEKLKVMQDVQGGGIIYRKIGSDEVGDLYEPFMEHKFDSLEQADAYLEKLLEKEPTQTLAQKRTIKAFEDSKGQMVVGKIGDAEIVIGSYGRNAIVRKTDSGKEHRLPVDQLPDALRNAKQVFKAGNDGFRKDNLIVLSDLPSSAIVLRKNEQGKEEVINFFAVPLPVKYAKTLETFGAPDRSRTDIFSLEGKQSNPLAYGDKESVSKPAKKVKQAVVSNQERDQYYAQLYDVYNATGPSNVDGFTKADEELNGLLMEIDLAEAGQRSGFMNYSGPGLPVYVNTSTNSTFPKWIDEDLRSKELFDKVFSGIERTSDLKYPSRPNATKQRIAFNAMLDQLDVQLGIDTKDIRSNIMKTYGKNESTNKAGLEAQDQRGTAGGERVSGRAEVAKQADVQEKEPIAKPEDLHLPEHAVGLMSWTSFNPEGKVENYRNDFAMVVNRTNEELLPLAKTEAQQYILKEEMARFKEGYEKKVLEVFNADSKTANAAVTGPARFNFAKNDAKINRYMALVAEEQEYVKKAKSAIKKKLEAQFVADSGGEIQVAKDRLVLEKQRLEMMKSSNAIARKKGLTDTQKISEMMKLPEMTEKVAAELLTPNFMGKTGFMPFQLTSQNAQIKRLEEKIAKLEKQEAAQDSGTGTSERMIGNVRVVEDVGEDRIRLYFPGKPSEEMIKKLKSRAFRWSPFNKAWQRQLTNDARYATKMILGDGSEQAPAVEVPTSNSDDAFDIGIFRDGTPVKVGHLNEIKPVEMPELVDLARELMGKTPRIVEKVGRKIETRGIFRGRGDGTIELRSDLFSDINQASKTLAHEIGHLVDWLPTKTLSRGNLLGRLAVLNKFRKNTFEGIIATNKEISAELTKVTEYWRPYDKTTAPESFIKYRKQAKEMYADAVSMLYNSPGLLEEMAPNFYKEFFAQLDKKPDVRDAYFEIQSMLQGDRGVLIERRREGVQAMFKEGDLKSEEIQKILSGEKDAQERDLSFRLRFGFITTNTPVIIKMDELEKKGVIVNPDDNPLYFLEERNYLGGKMKAIVETDFAPSFYRMKDNGISWHEFGEALFYERVAFGDRSEQANPRGITPDAAVELLDAMKKQYGEKWAIIESSMNEFRGAIKNITKEAHAEGLISDKTWEGIKENDKYATFKVIEYIDEEVNSKIYHSVGTFKDITNPADASILKALATVKAIERNKVVRKFRDSWEKNFSSEIIEAEQKFENGRIRYVERNDGKYGTIFMMEKGKLKAYYVDPYIAKSIRRETVAQNRMVLEVLSPVRALNRMIFRPMFITFNPGFQAFNLVRDFRRFWKNVPGMTFAKAGKLYYEALPAAKLRAFGLPKFSGKRNAIKETEAYKTLLEMEREQVLSATFNDILADASTDEAQIMRILRETGVESEVPKTKIRALKPFVEVLEFIKKVGDVIETLPKVSSYVYLKAKTGRKLTMEEKSFIRKNVGSPDFFDKGYFTPMSNEVFLFSNSILQGTRSDINIATAPKTRGGYWWKTAKIDIIPKLLMMAAAIGLFGYELKKMFEDASEYDKTNYTIIPLGRDSTGKTVYFRLPHDESGRLIGGIVWKALNTENNKQPIGRDLMDVLSYTAGNLPSVSPSITYAAAATQYLSGKNPYDSFRGREVLSEDVFTAGGWRAHKAFAKWSFQELGGGVFMKFNIEPRAPEEKGTAEQIFSLPILSNTLGRFFRVTDYGQTEKLRQTTDVLKREAAERRLVEKELLNKYLKRYQNDPSEGMKPQYRTEFIKEVFGGVPTGKDEVDRAKTLLKRFDLAVIRGDADPQTEALLNAGSNTEKAAILLELRNDMEKEAFRTFLTDMLAAKIITEDVLQKMLK